MFEIPPGKDILESNGRRKDKSEKKAKKAQKEETACCQLAILIVTETETTKRLVHLSLPECSEA